MLQQNNHYSLDGLFLGTDVRVRLEEPLNYFIDNLFALEKNVRNALKFRQREFAAGRVIARRLFSDIGIIYYLLVKIGCRAGQKIL